MEFAIGRYIYRDGDDVFADGCPFCFDDFVGAFGVGWISWGLKILFGSRVAF